MERKKIIIGSRSSKLALIYAEKAKMEISRFYKDEIVINDSGDRIYVCSDTDFCSQFRDINLLSKQDEFKS